MEFQRSKGDEEVSQGKIKTFFNGKPIFACDEQLSKVDPNLCDVEHFLPYLGDRFLTSDFASLCQYGSEESRSVIKGLMLGVMLLLIFAMLISITILILNQNKYKMKVKVMEFDQDQEKIRKSAGKAIRNKYKQY